MRWAASMGGPEATRGFARLFVVPGMDHCAGGKGAYAINYMAAIEDWVERGKAPEALVGVHPLAGSPLDYAQRPANHHGRYRAADPGAEPPATKERGLEPDRPRSGGPPAG